ncbi:zinc dependent phospholipase C family protein [[Flexibacter] sp. ATCC 35208]|uniref:zinc dependent phospholipase C family protein n=1 Tax=[Flexibacter] sp. ATCC 35208 TaxID=1936242 RepID=UPI0009D13497|nr:zinc dependent phospholipase C family protein [[Flexibacter] sp. ATCC 35208]OMP78326.1 S1/P1 Nuclease [[Flexibacter] sp. ATCC 35208]
MFFKRLFSIVVCILLPFKTVGWGFFAHQRINELAVFSLPPAMLALYKPQQAYLKAHATDADKRRYIVAAEGPRHYIDIDHYGSPPYDWIPRSWPAALLQFGEDSLLQYGIVPWYIPLMMARLSKAFQEKDPDKILRFSADLGHYVADAHVPLHACSNHNGQFTGQEGIHGLWESRIPELLADGSFNYWCGKAVYIRDVPTFIWQVVSSSAGAADTVLKQEKALSQRTPPDTKYAYENRKGKLVRTYATSYTKAYQQLLGDMVERRMRAAIHAVASCWYTAWVDAGQPPLNNINKKLKENTPLPDTGKMIGRVEE